MAAKRSFAPATKKWHLALDLGMFLLTVVLAIYSRWSATDLVWSLWISSLTVGYSFILTAIIALSIARGKEQWPGAKTRRQIPVLSVVMPVAAGLICALIALAFLTVHFGGFHFVHGHFLYRFFPFIEGKTRDASFLEFAPKAFFNYWGFVLLSAFSRWEDYWAALRNPNESDILGKPYFNVIRMHIMIFVFAFLDITGLKSYALYPVLFFYFFPFHHFVEVQDKSPRMVLSSTSSGAEKALRPRGWKIRRRR